MKTLLVMSFLILGASAFAAEPETAVPATVEVTTQPANEPSKVESGRRRSAPRDRGPSLTSYENRENLKYQITASVLGHEYVAFSPITVSFGYYIDPDNILIARYSNYNGSDSWDDEDDDGNSESLRAVTVGLRHFFANSFNIMPTAYYRRSKKEGDYSIFSGNRGKLIYEDVGVGVRIGNEWQWKNFTMGCDWAGLNRTVVEIHDEKTGGNWDDFDSDRKYTLTLASFYLGFSF